MIGRDERHILVIRDSEKGYVRDVQDLGYANLDGNEYSALQDILTTKGYCFDILIPQEVMSFEHLLSWAKSLRY